MKLEDESEAGASSERMKLGVDKPSVSKPKISIENWDRRASNLGGRCEEAA